MERLLHDDDMREWTGIFTIVIYSEPVLSRDILLVEVQLPNALQIDDRFVTIDYNRL